jgi:hypothetical protein
MFPELVIISDSVRNSKWNGRFAQCAGSVHCNDGRAFLPGHTLEELFPNPGTTTPDRESWAPDSNSILRHA